MKIGLFFLLFLCHWATGQNIANPQTPDIELIAAHNNASNFSVANHPHAVFEPKGNPVSFLGKGLLFFYQKMLSDQIQATCMYSPSCSEFGRQSIAHFGLIKGILLTGDRLTRCNDCGKEYEQKTAGNLVHDPVLRYKNPKK